MQKSWGFRDRESVGRNRDETSDEEPRLEFHNLELGSSWMREQKKLMTMAMAHIFNYAHLSNPPPPPPFFFFCLFGNENMRAAHAGFEGPT